MLVPLYEAVYERLDVGPGTRLLGLGCGTGLALLMAASRGAAVTGVESGAPERLALARERLLGEGGGNGTGGAGRGTPAHTDTRLVAGAPGDAVVDTRTPSYTLITAFEPIGGAAGDTEGLGELLSEATPLARRGAPVVLVGWGPPERCVTSKVLRVASRLADPLPGSGPGSGSGSGSSSSSGSGSGTGRTGRGAGTGAGARPGTCTASWRPARRDDLEEVAQRAGLRPDGSGRVACPFGYADVDSAVRGLLSTGFFDAAVEATDRMQVDKEVREAVHPYRRPDGAVWMPNVFRYLIARTV